ncbi:hypothetical protein ESA2_CDS10 [Staphylococcus phage ESa2]|nr:hypothetical protein ESA2_CDS10 [Staphylococcus phage ESa2]
MLLFPCCTFILLPYDTKVNKKMKILLKTFLGLKLLLYRRKKNLKKVTQKH